MAYAVYYRTGGKDKNWKRCSELYINRKGVLAAKPKRFEDKDTARQWAASKLQDGYEIKIIEIQ